MTGPTLSAGFARVDITPDWSLPLAGFAARTRPSEGVAHPLHVRAAALQTDGPGGRRERALVLAADLLNWGPEQLPDLRREVAARCGVPEDRILFAASHTHSGPQPNRWQLRATGVADDRFLQLLADRTVQAAELAVRRQEPVSLHRGVARHDLGMYRRRLVGGRVVAGPNPDGPRDPALTVLAFRRPDGSLAGALVHYTCHPVISTEYLLSGDYAGAAMSAWERRSGAFGLFLQGCCGDINPGAAAHRGLAEVDRQAAALAAAVEAVLAGPLHPLPACPLAAEWARARLPFDHRLTTAEIQAACAARGPVAEWGHAFQDHPDRVTDAAELALQRLDLAAGQSLLAMDGEPSVAYGLAVRAESGGSVLPVAYSNGMVGYVPTAEQLGEGGYEAVESTWYYLLPGRFSPRIEASVRDAALGLVRRVAAPS